MSLFNSIRYAVTALPRLFSSMRRFNREAIKFHIGHTKIIGWEQGRPVRSLLIPAEGSNPFILSAARNYTAHRYSMQYPGLATLSITAACDCQCHHCGASFRSETDLSTDQWIPVVRRVQDLGVFTISITGGEPLLRDDLPDIISAINPEKSICLVYSNGSRLVERARDLARAGLKRIHVSIDFADSDAHDTHRGSPGLMAAALAGIEEARRAGMLVGISTFVSPQRLADGTFEHVLKLGAELNVNEIAVFDAMPSRAPGTEPLPLMETPEYLARLRKLIQAWWRNPKVPGLWWYGQLRSYDCCGCPGGTSMFNISPGGNMRPCDFCPVSVGSVLENDLQSLWLRLNAIARKRRDFSVDCWLKQPDSLPVP